MVMADPKHVYLSLPPPSLTKKYLGFLDSLDILWHCPLVHYNFFPLKKKIIFYHL